MHRLPLTALLCAAAIAAPAPASAQSTFNYYTAPKLVKQGKNTTPVAGNGTVVIKVLVNKDGSSKVQGVVHSTNHGDDAAALEIAATSTYKPATRGPVKETAFYDYTLKFVGRAASTAPTDPSGLAQYERMIRAANYSGASTGLKTYLQSHADDARAQLDLGIAATFLNQFADAAAAFDKAGDIPANYKSVAGKAYAEAAVERDGFLRERDTGVVVLGLNALAPSFATYNTLGFGENASANYAAAIVDLEKARSLGASEGVTAKQRALVDANLAATYLAAGNTDKAKEIAAEARQLDPQTSTEGLFVNFYAKQAADLNAAGKSAEAAAVYEQAAAIGPSSAATLYAQAALAYLRVKPTPDNAKAKVDADKALAADPASALANFAKGVALANDGKSKDAMDFLKKADDESKKGNDPGLTSAIENTIKQLSGTK
jgi:tetratricopeptide (TPR) repeat protein